MAIQVGDSVRVVNDKQIWLEALPSDTILKVTEDRDGFRYVNNDELTIEITAIRRHPTDFVKVTMITEEVSARAEVISELGIFRPQLETRKVGKVRVELVDDGFPLALREVAKVMTWAQTAKGYKDHDWQNLPNWEQQLAAATSRHRTDLIIQRQVEGLEFEDCNDEESKLIHKAHEAFGVLAQLEKMLREIKSRK
jgi:hypothetical protein